MDGILNPGGPTIHALGWALAAAEGAFGLGGFDQRPPGQPPDDDDCCGIVPDLMAEDFSLGASGRAKTADFLGQLFRRDPAHSAATD